MKNFKSSYDFDLTLCLSEQVCFNVVFKTTVLFQYRTKPVLNTHLMQVYLGAKKV